MPRIAHRGRRRLMLLRGDDGEDGSWSWGSSTKPMGRTLALRRSRFTTIISIIQVMMVCMMVVTAKSPIRVLGSSKRRMGSSVRVYIASEGENVSLATVRKPSKKCGPDSDAIVMFAEG